MSWSLRLQQMIMAGGVFSFSACGNGHRALGQTIPGTDAGSKEPGVTVPMTPFPVPIGNGSPDPCMFGRAGGSPDAEQICEACWMSYGQWQPATSTAPARCIGGADAAGDAVGDVATDPQTPTTLYAGTALDSAWSTRRRRSWSPSTLIITDQRGPTSTGFRGDVRGLPGRDNFPACSMIGRSRQRPNLLK